MKNLSLADILSFPVVTVTPEFPVREALTLMHEKRISALVVTEKQHPVGVFTERDAVLLAYRNQDYEALRVEEVMGKPPLTATPEIDYREGYRIISEQNVRHLIVVDGTGVLAGIVSESDFLDLLGSEFMVRYKEVGALMTHNILTLPEDATVKEAVCLMGRDRVSCVVIEKNAQAVGIFTERDLIRLESNHEENASKPLSMVMSRPVRTVAVDMSLHEAIEIMDSEHIRRLVVVDEHKHITGLLTHHDIVKRLYSRHVEHLKEKLTEKEHALKEAAAKLQLEREFRRYEKYLTDSQRLAHIGSWELNLLTDHLWWSEESYKIFEVDPGQIDASYEAFLDLVHPDDREFVHNAYTESVANRTSYDIVHRLQFNDGRIKFVNEHCETFYDDEGKPLRSIGTVQDITENRESEIALLEGEEKLRLFIEHAPAALAMFDRQMRYVDISRRWVQDYGLENRNILGRSHYEIFPEIPERWKAVYRRGLEGEIIREDEDRLVRLDGTIQYLQWEVQPWYMADGAVGGIVIFTEDITKRKQIEEHYRTLFERTGTCMGMLEADGTFSLVNQTFAELAGSTSETLIGSSFIDFLDEADRERLQAYHAKRLRGEDAPESYEFKFISRKGNRGTGLLNAVYLPGTRQTIVSIIDITDRKRAESELIQRERELNAIVEAIPLMIFVKDAEHLKFVRFNTAGEEMTGHTKEELIGQSDYDFFPKEEADFFTARDKEVLASGKVLDVQEEPIHTPLGMRILHTKKIPITDENGKPRYLLGVSEDITERKQSEQTLRESEKKYRSLFNDAQDMIHIVDRKGNIVDSNPAELKTLGYSRDELLGKPLVELIAPEYRNKSKRMLGKVFKGETLSSYETVLLAQNGRRIDVEASDTAHLENGKVGSARAILRNITDRKAKEEQLRQAAAVYENTSEGIVITDKEARIISINDAFTAITGYSKDEVLGKNPNLLQSGHHDDLFYSQMWDSLQESGQWQGEIWNRRKNGQIFPEWLSISTIKDQLGALLNYIAVFSDISKIKKTEDELRFLAHHDPLTQLPNRLLLHERLEHSLERAQRKEGSVAVLFIDLDRFKEVNDSFGHPYGDLLLQKIAERLRKLLRDEDTVARVSGDEFVVVLEEIRSGNEAALVAQKILNAMSEPAMIEMNEITITGSIGIAVSSSDGTDATVLLKNADTALYRAKDQGRNSFEFFSEEMAASSFELLYLHNALHSALKKEEFIVYYQPQVNLETGKIIGTEALVRWNSPEMGLVSPMRFIPVAEDTGLIVPLGKWILREACLQMKRWLEAGTSMEYVAVNISGRQLSHNNIIETVKEALRYAALDARHLELEITESTIMKEERYVKLLNELKALGIRLSIDDFGTGYSSLLRLKHMPIDKLKIDQSFVSGIPKDQDDTKITQTVIALAESLNLDVIAEGVETREQAEYLLKKGCKKAQGYHYSRPVPPSELEEWIRSRLGKKLF